jgi:hypothetical protein
MPRRKYYHVSDGEVLEVPWRGYKEMCCDCHLVHRHNFKVNEKGKLEIQSFRDDRATAAARKHKKVYLK